MRGRAHVIRAFRTPCGESPHQNPALVDVGLSGCLGTDMEVNLQAFARLTEAPEQHLDSSPWVGV